VIHIPKLVVRVSQGLKDKIAEAAEEEDKLPTEWVRDVLREAFEGETEPETEDEDSEAERDE